MCIRNKVIISIFLVIFVLSISQLNAEEGELKSTPIEVIAESGDDLVGSRLIYEVKEQIRKSYAFRLTTKEEPRYQLRITTQDPLFSLTSEWHNLMTVYSVVWTFEVIEGEFSFPLYLHSAVGVVEGITSLSV